MAFGDFVIRTDSRMQFTVFMPKLAKTIDPVAHARNPLSGKLLASLWLPLRLPDKHGSMDCCCHKPPWSGHYFGQGVILLWLWTQPPPKPSREWSYPSRCWKICGTVVARDSILPLHGILRCSCGPIPAYPCSSNVLEPLDQSQAGIWPFHRPFVRASRRNSGNKHKPGGTSCD